MGAEVRNVAVIDVGKTNVKLVVHDLDARRDLASRSIPNRVVAGAPYPHADTEAIFAFIVRSLAELAREHPVDAISISAHGACAALVDASGTLALPILDYEHPLGDLPEYETARPPFAQTLSPSMANGLNVGRQLFWLQQNFPERFAAAQHILFHPQYWAFRLTGQRACEMSSLGCHTDLWAPDAQDFSDLVSTFGWRDLFAPMRSAFDALGTLSPEVAAMAGLEGRDIPVACGIHDSNASLLPHLLALPTPFTLLSTGTWVVGFAVGGGTLDLDPARNTLAHVDAFGRPVPAASFMGGREFDLLAEGAIEEPDESALAAVVSRNIMALPPVVPRSGPFPERLGGWDRTAEPATPAERVAAASLYVALTARESLALIGAQGPIVVEGPLARNAIVVRALSQMTGRAVLTPQHGTGTSAGAALLARGRPGVSRPETRPDAAETPSIDGLEAYAATWRDRIAMTDRIDA